MRPFDLFLRVYIAAMIVFLLAPIILVIISSFTSSDFIHFPPVGLSLRHYREALNVSWFLSALQTSIITAFVSATLALLIGAPAAISLTRYQFPGRQAMQLFLLSPLMVPTLVLGVTLLYFYSALQAPPSIAVLIAAHLVLTLPFAVRLLTVSLMGVDRRLEQAATSLGAPPLKAFISVTLPNISAGAAAAFAFSAIVSFDDIGLALFVAPAQRQTLPVAIFTYLDQNYDPMIMAVASFTILISLVAIIVLDRTVGVSKVFMNVQAQ